MAAPDLPDSSGAVPGDLRAIAGRVEARVAVLLDRETARWAELDPRLVDPIEALRRLVLGGGKRLRPAFCHWGFVAGGGDPADPVVVDAGAAYELLQAFALVHDDVMDGSGRRRAAPTVHRWFEAIHDEAGWRGEGRRFGEGVAILVGDLAHVYADQLLPVGPPDVAAIWDELRIELNIGQYLDVLGTARRDLDPVAARRIARYKSGKYTIERPLHLGAALAGRFGDLGAALSAYGDPLGEAFQLRDDILGVFGDEAVVGKPVGDDLREGKPTLLLAIAAERCNPAERELLDLVGTPDLAPGDVTRLQELFVSTGALAEVEATIDQLSERAVAALAEAPVPDVARRALTELAPFVARRSA